jgi:hypothetical protein
MRKAMIILMGLAVVFASDGAFAGKRRFAKRHPVKARKAARVAKRNPRKAAKTAIE